MKAVLFDLYETLITDYNPDRRREQRGARLGLAEDYFDREWGARHRTGDLLGSTQATWVRCFGGGFCRRWQQFRAGRC